jgi:cell wall-associated NlpC family hydrolase
MALSFGELFYGIASQESGGNYGAVNGSSGALGKYQIMPANVPSWSQKYLGVSWSPSQFLADPNKQETLAKAVLQDYYNKYGARGAASAWYSGNPALQNSYSAQNGGPSVGSYVDQVLAKGTGHPGNVAGGATPPSPTQGSFPITTIDKTVKPPGQQTAPDSTGMGEMTASGVGAVTDTTPGIDAFDNTGTRAVGDPSNPSVGTPAPAAPKITMSAGAASAPGATASTSRQLAINEAMKLIGTPYVWGGGSGSGPSSSPVGVGVGVDCSGLVQAALTAAGITSSHFSYTQLSMGQKVPLSQLQPGDLVGMNGGAHIGLYAGNGQIIVADHTGTNVRMRAIGPNEGAFGVSLANYFK